MGVVATPGGTCMLTSEALDGDGATGVFSDDEGATEVVVDDEVTGVAPILCESTGVAESCVLDDIGVAIKS